MVIFATPRQAVAATHTVTLRWQAPASPTCPITAYNVYRVTALGTEVIGPHPLTPAGIPPVAGSAQSFIDTTAQSGTTYGYKVGAWEPQCANPDGPLSNEATATIPKDGTGANDAPTGAAAVVNNP